MGFYSQWWNMVCISGIWITTQSENIIAPSNKNKLSITIMQIALKQYLGFNQSQTMRGSRWIEMEMVLMLGMMLMWIERPPLRQGEVVKTMVSVSPFQKASKQQDLSSPRVGDDFRLSHRLCKLWEREIWRPFSGETEASVKRESRDDAQGANGFGWRGPVRWPRHLVSFSPLALLACFFRIQSFSWWKTYVVFSPELFGFQNVPETTKYEKTYFMISRN
jgi:hypothetical protein